MIKNHTSAVALLIFLLLIRISLAVSQNTTTLVNVGMILDSDSLFGKIGLSCVEMALSDFYSVHAHYNTRVMLHTRDSMRDIVAEAAAALDLINNVEVQAMIIGSESSMQANFVIDLSNKAQVPIISFSTAGPSVLSFNSPYYFRAVQNDSSQVMVISSIIQAFEWVEAVPIYIVNEFEEGVVPYLTNALQEIGVRIPYWSVIPSGATDDQIEAKLQQLITMQTRVFIVHMLPSLGSRFFSKAKHLGMMDVGYVWIVTDVISNSFGSISSSDLEDMQGVLGLKAYVPITEELQNFTYRWLRKFQKDNPTIFNVRKLDSYGLWAHDTAWALAMAIEKVGATNFNFHKANISDTSSDLERLRISPNGPELSQALSDTIFRGLSGNFSLLHGQLQGSNFQIVNVNGNGEREIGYWSPQTGLVRKLNSTYTNSYFPTSNASVLGPIIWPGETTSIPRGWQIRTHEGELKVLVPVNNGFQRLINVSQEPLANTTNATGYCIDVFKAVLDALQYNVPVQFYAFAKPNGQPAGDYNDMVLEVYHGKYDAAVGDISDQANRSSYVDFTLPYTDSEIMMIVPIKRNKNSKSAWVFLQPLTWDLWATIGCFFVFIAFVIWVLEHHVNNEFHGPPHKQIGTSVWFSFSTMVFAHKEEVVSNLARFVVIVWCFVVLVLTQSYTASLTSLLTVQQLQPTDVYQLLQNGMNIGYQEGSFVYDILINQLGFYGRLLTPYKSVNELDALFEKGVISAAFDETPYVKDFLSTYCLKYTMVTPNMVKAGGFAFVFPKGSTLTRDFSRAITSVQMEGRLRLIEKEWFWKPASCIDPNPSVELSNISLTLSLDSFWGLFLIALLAPSSALLIFASMFLYQHGHILIRSNPSLSFWSRICILFQKYYQEDISSDTIIKQQGPETVDSTAESTPSHSSLTASQTVVLEMKETSSTTHGDSIPIGQATQAI